MTEADMNQSFRSGFGRDPEVAAFAPGRLEFIGNHTDYNGGLVLGAAVTEGITVAVARREDRRVVVISGGDARAEWEIDRGRPLEGEAAWANYVAGVVWALREAGAEIPGGFSMTIESTLARGAGMSSSAALELSAARAVAALFGFEADAGRYARLGRKAENEFVGVPCGILDQGVSAFGRANHLVRIDCATEEFSVVPMPPDTHFWVFNSNKKHALVDSQYAERFRQCGVALDCLRQRDAGLVNLADASEQMVRDAEGELGDVLFRRALHVVTENRRVREVEAALAAGQIERVGAALWASHESSRVNFENSCPELDFLVGRLKEERDVYGARLTGGGFGGAVMALTGPGFNVRGAGRITEACRNAFGFEPTVLHTRAGDGMRLL